MNEANWPLSITEHIFLNANRQTKVFLANLENKTLPCFPGADGYADTTAATNAVTGFQYTGANFFILKDHAKRNNYPTAEYLSEEQIEVIRKDKPSIAVKHGEEGISIFFTNNESSGGGEKWEAKYERLFNVSQTNQPWEIKAWVNDKKQEQIDFYKKEYGVNIPDAKKKPGPVIHCTSTDPVKFLGEFFAAKELNGKFEVSPEQEAQFAFKAETLLSTKMDNGHINPFTLSKICNEASLYSKEVIQEIKTEAIRKERAFNMEQSRGRSR